MSVQRMDHVGVVVEDFDTARAFFVALGLEVSDEWTTENELADRVIGLRGARSRCAFLTTPDGHGKLELIAFERPADGGASRPDPSHAPGLRHLCFAVDDVRATVERLAAHGGELVGDLVDYEGTYLLCYLRGPSGVIVELAERL